MPPSWKKCVKSLFTFLDPPPSWKIYALSLFPLYLRLYFSQNSIYYQNYKQVEGAMRVVRVGSMRGESEDGWRMGIGGVRGGEHSNGLSASSIGSMILLLYTAISEEEM